MFGFGPRRTLHLDVGSSSCKWLLNDGGAWSVGEVPLPEGAVHGTYSSVGIDFPRVAETLRTTLGEVARGADLAVACGDQFLKFLYVRLPRDAALRADRDYTLFRLRRTLDPAIVKEAELDFFAHESLRDDKSAPDDGLDPAESHLNVLAARHELLKGFHDLAAHLRADLRSTVSTSALLTNLPKRRGLREFIIIHLGHEVTTVNLVSAGIVMYQRVIETAGRHLAQAVHLARSAGEPTGVAAVDSSRSALPDAPKPDSGINGDESIDFLSRELSLPTRTGDLGAAVLGFDLTRRLFARLLDEIAVTFKFFRETHRRPLPERLFLSGGLARIPHLAEFFGGVFRLEAETLTARAGGLDFPPDRVALADHILEKGGGSGVDA